MFLSFKCISDFPPFLGCHQLSFGCHNSSCLVLVTVFLLTFLHTSLKHLLCLLLLNRSLLSPAWNSDYCAFFKAIWGLVCSNSSLWFPTLPSQLCLLSSQLYIVVVGQSLCPVWPLSPMDCSMSGFPDLYWLWVCLNSCPLSWWCIPFNYLILCLLLLLLPSIFPRVRVFSSE